MEATTFYDFIGLISFITISAIVFFILGVLSDKIWELL
nr:MAG TPA: Endothelial cell-specific chemotaxis regulator [Caudoviricetes sp.]